METMSGGIKFIDTGNAEIFAGPVESLRRQHLMPAKFNPKSNYNLKTKYAVVIDYYTLSAAPDCRGFDDLESAYNYLDQLESVNKVITGPARYTAKADRKKRQEINQFKKKGAIFLESVPDGWIIDPNATNHPAGYHWYYNQKSFFNGQRQSALIPDERPENKSTD